MPRWLLRFTPFVLALALEVPLARGADGVDIGEATDVQKKTAQDRYSQGTKEFEAKRFEEAYAQFTASYGIVRSPNAHLMMARALIELGQPALAYNELAVVEREASGQARYAGALEKSRALRADAAKKIAIVSLDIRGDRRELSKVTIDDIPAPLDGDFGVRPGTVTVRVFPVTKPNVPHPEHGLDDRVVELKAGEVRTVVIDVGSRGPDPKLVITPPPGPAATSTSPEDAESPVGPILVVAGSIAATLGGSGVLLGGVLYQLAVDDYDELVLGCGEPTADRKAQCRAGVNVARLKEAGAEKQTLATVAFVAGGLTAAVGIGLVIGGDALNRDAAQERAVAVRILPGRIVVEGTF